MKHRPVVVRPEAEADMAASYNWYEARFVGLGSHFLLCVDAIIHSISRAPKQYPFVHKNIRRAITRRFPYAVFYTEGENAIVVLAVFHAKRDPRTWQKRTPKSSAKKRSVSE